MAFRLKSEREIEAIGVAGSLVDHTLRALSDLVREVTCEESLCTSELRRRATQLLAKSERSHLTVSINDIATHGCLKSDMQIGWGDLVTVDVAVCLGGWWADAATTLIAGSANSADHPERSALLDASVGLTTAAVEAFGRAASWSEVAHAVRVEADQRDVVIVGEGSGHGIGRSLHESPAAGYSVKAGGPGDFRLVPGVVVTLEPIVSTGADVLIETEEGLRTGDGRAACYTEVTIARTSDGVRILAGGEILDVFERS